MKNLFFSILISALNKQPYISQRYFAKKKVLDLGCGTGKILKLSHPNSAGVDINEETLSLALQKNLNVLKASATHLPFNSSTFDSINCNNLIEHLTPNQAYSMLLESARVLKPKGYLIIHTQTATHKIWNTFSHIRPYPPSSILKLTSSAIDKENYKTIINLKPIAIYYEGEYFSNRLLFLITTLLAQVIPPLRRDYTMVLKKIRSPQPS